MLIKGIYKFILILTNLKLHNIIPYIWILALKKINSPINKRYNVLVIPKSGGMDDLYNKSNIKLFNNSNIQIYKFNRNLFQPIADYSNASRIPSHDYFNSRYDNIRNKYYLLLINLFTKFKKIKKIDLIISFNFFDIEREIIKVCDKLNIKFLIMYKESLKNQFSWNETREFLKKNIYKSNTFVALYTDDAKKYFQQTNKFNITSLQVTGCGRVDYAHNIRKKRKILKYENKRKIKVVYYLIQKTAGLPIYDNKIYENGRPVPGMLEQFNWNKLSESFNKSLMNIIENNHFDFDLELIIKGKVGFIEEQKKFIKYNKSKIMLIEEGPGHLLLNNADLIIAFHSTIILEAVAAGIPICMPYYNKNIPIEIEKHVFDTPDNVFKPKNENELFDYIKKLNHLKFSNSLNIQEINFLNKFTGNSEGSCSVNNFKFIEKIIN